MNETTSTIITGTQAAVTNMMSFLPKLGLFLVVLIGGYFIAKWIGKLVNRVLERAGFDRLVERGGVKKVLQKTQYDASDIMCKIVFYTLFLFVLQLAFGIFGQNPISDILTRVIAFLPTLFVALLIVVIAAAVAKGVKEIMTVALGGLSYGRMLANIGATAIVVLGVFAALSHLQIAPAIVNGLFYAGLAVIAGSAIVAIGGGGIAPMRQQWERALNKVEQEKPRIQAQTEGASERVKSYAEARKEELKGEMQQGNAPAPAEHHEEEQHVVAEKPRFETKHL